MQSASRVRGTRHRGYGTRSRALARGRVTSKTKRPHNLPSRVLGRDSALGDGTAAVDGKLKGDGVLGCSGLNPGRGDGPHRPIAILLPRTVNESIGRPSRSSLRRFRLTSFLLGGSSLVKNEHCRFIKPSQALARSHAIKTRMPIIIFWPRKSDCLQCLFLNFIFHPAEFLPPGRRCPAGLLGAEAE